MEDYILEELSPEVQQKITEEITAVLEKYNAEIGVKSVIQLLKRAPVNTPIPSPYTNGEDTETPEVAQAD